MGWDGYGMWRKINAKAMQSNYSFSTEAGLCSESKGIA